MAVEGVDVSHFQGKIEWAQVHKAGKSFAFLKATDGPVWPDPCFAENRPGAHAAGIVVGVYHFARLRYDPKVQASFLKQTVGSTSGELPPAVDLEPSSFDPAPATTHADPSKYAWEGTPTEWLREFDAAVHQEMGRHPILYFPSSFWSSSMAGTSGFDKRHAWIAEYPGVTPLPPGPTLPTGWTKWTFWQYSSSGKVPGIPSATVDLDRFNGEEKDLRALLK